VTMRASSLSYFYAFPPWPNTDIYTDITLIAPNSAAPAIKEAMDTNPYFAKLPTPKPVLLAPEDLDDTMGTAEIFRLPEVREVIKGDFIVLPCDLICELPGESLIESWMILQAGLGGATGGGNEFTGPKMALGGEKSGRRGGLAVWYDTEDNLIKDEETDFIVVARREGQDFSSLDPGARAPKTLLPNTYINAQSMPTATLNDIIEAKGCVPLRHALLDKHGKVRLLTRKRDAHIYILPAWVLDMINKNAKMESVAEDVIGFWAKATWQRGLGEKLHLDEIFNAADPAARDENLLGNAPSDEIDISTLSSTMTSKLKVDDKDPKPKKKPKRTAESSDEEEDEKPKERLLVPPILAYLHPKSDDLTKPSPLIRRVDTATALLAVSLQLAKLEAIDTAGDSASSFAHPSKVAYQSGIASKTTITRQDCLLAENVTVEEKVSIKESVIGANCTIREGAKLMKCVLMDSVTVGKGSRLTGCVLGKRSVIGEKCDLTECEIQENLVVENGTEDKNNKLMSSEGMEATEEELQEFVDEEGGDEELDLGLA
jgi:translation initiation factor eIF-2B subunit gamma